MRFIDTSSLRLVEIDESSSPRYAVLSHTWGQESDEISFSDMKILQVNNMRRVEAVQPILAKSGFAKIRDSALLALGQGINYIWIDTCCIDKTSSAELSEAINSMFRWYQNSVVCYALLSDVSGNPNEAPPGPFYYESSESAKRDALVPFGAVVAQTVRQSRWFTRGWTLQELIAPRNVMFFSRYWKLLGTKRDISGFPGLISDITRIQLEVLTGSQPLESVSIANRMQWASHRQTSRPEDAAYCLMGIFDVNMPLLYGEGARAFIRLQKEILQGSNDQSLFAWQSTREFPAPSSGLSGLLAPSPACFKYSGHIRPLSLNASRISTPSAMTNLGLQTQFSLVPVSPGSTEHIAILDCVPYTLRNEDGEKQLSRIAIRLVLLGGDRFARVKTENLFTVPVFSNAGSPTGNLRQVFVSQRPELLFPDVVLSGLETIHSRGGDLVTVWPPEQWNSADRTLRPQGSHGDGIIAAFRFKFDRDGGKSFLIDVFLGLSLNPGTSSWVAWCQLQHPLAEQSLGLSVTSSNAPASEAARGESVSFHIGADHRPVIFKVVWHHRNSAAQVSLTIDTLHELPATLIRPVSDSPNVYKYERLAKSLAIYESATLDLRSQYSATDAIRISRSGGSSDCRQTLEQLRDLVANSLADFGILRPNQLSPNAFEEYFSKLLVTACIKNDLKAIEELVESPLSTALVNAWAFEVRISRSAIDGLDLLNGFRPLHWATLFGNAEAVRVLLKHGAGPLQDTWTGLTAIHIAMVMDQPTVLEELLIQDSFPQDINLTISARISDKLSNFAVSFLSQEHVGSVLRNLSNVMDSDGLESSFSRPNALGEMMLHRACAMDNLSAVEWAIDWHAEGELINLPDKRGRTPLFHAAAAGSIRISLMLISKGADMTMRDDMGRSVLDVACRQGHEALFLELFAAAQVAAASLLRGSLPFNVWHFAVLSENKSMLRTLHEHVGYLGANLSDADAKEDFITPLHIASANGQFEVVKILCESGFGSSAKAKTRYTPVWEMADGDGKVIKIHVADIQQDATEWAAAYGHRDIVDYLSSQ